MDRRTSRRVLPMSRGAPAAILIIVGFVALAVALYVGFRLDDNRGDDTGADEPPWALLDDSDAFKRPQFPREFSFPADHGAHSGYRTEWWNLAGSLEDERGNRLGVHLTMTRLGLLAEPPDRASRWAAADVYAGVFSVSDPVRGRLRTDVRVSRAAIGLAGASASPRKVWVEDWKLEQTGATGATLALTAQSQSGEVMLTLALLNE
jgi:predicted secreted hydrolase